MTLLKVNRHLGGSEPPNRLLSQPDNPLQVGGFRLALYVHL